jgi:D-3-phosphoglycerate dehydrogenase
MPSPIVLLTNPMDAGIAEALSRRFELRHAPATDAETLRAMARDAQYIVVRAPLPADLFTSAPVLRAVVRHGAGLDMIPMIEASAQGVAVANVPAVNARSVAEYAMGQILSLARQLPEMEGLLRAGQWNAARAATERLPDLHGKTVAIVGMGAIGRALAGMCTAGFGMRVLGVRRSAASDGDPIQCTSLDDALHQADFLVLACPLTDATRHLINDKALAQAKPGLFIVNVARGAVIDTPALIAALEKGQVAGAALDVFETQPLPCSSRLRELPRVRLTPHLAGITKDSMQRMSAGVAEQLLQMQAGHLPRHLCNPQAENAIRVRWARLGS